MVFIWLMLNNKILTIDNLMKRGWNKVNRCILCKRRTKTVSHIFSDCQHTQRVRQQAMQLVQQIQGGDYRNVIIREQNQKQRQFQVTLCFLNWRERCMQIFREESKQPMILTKTVKEKFQNWFHRSEIGEVA